MRILKRVCLAFCLCAFAASCCGCDMGSGDGEIITLELTFFESTPKEEIEELPEISDEAIVTTSPKAIERSIVNFTYEDYSETERTENMSLAISFCDDVVKSVLVRDLSMLNLDKYIDNAYLKEYVKNNLEQKIKEYSDIYGDKPNEYYAVVRLYPSEEVDGIEYYHIWYTIYDTIVQRTPCEPYQGPRIGIRGGRIVNIVNGPYMDHFQYCIYGWPQKATDSIYYPNPWDDEEVAQRVVKAFKMYTNGEYPYFQAAWDSLGE